jgi:peptidoglycan/LPS O-acetylase OafA/YrhL
MTHGIKERRYTSVDGLRAVAMSAVFLSHCGLFPIGWMGVWQFYAISGFVVTISLLGQSDKQFGHRAWKDFFVRRAKRILPIYFFMVLLALLVTYYSLQKFELQLLISYLLFFNNFTAPFGHISFSGLNTGHLWTISVEMQFYVIFGAIFFYARKYTNLFLILLVIAAPIFRSIYSYFLSSLDPNNAAYIIYTSSFMNFDAFALGALIAIHRKFLFQRKLFQFAIVVATLSVCTYATIYISLNVYLQDLQGFSAIRGVFTGVLWGEGRQIWLYTVVGFASAAIVLAATSPNGSPLLQWALNLPVLRWIGERSYGAYVYHAAIITSATKLFGFDLNGQNSIQDRLVQGGIVFLVAFPTTIAIAYCSYRWVEMPIITRGRRK